MNALIPSQAGLSPERLALALALSLTFFTASYALGRRLHKRGAISGKLAHLSGWCIGLTASVAALTFFQKIDAVWPARLAMAAAGVAAALVLVYGIDFLYGELICRLIRNRPANQLHLDLAKFAALVVYAFGFSKYVLDADVGSLFTSSAILTAVAALSMQDTIGSLIAGLVLQLEKPFTDGDFVSLAGIEGKYLGSSWRHTAIETLDRNTILIPNNLVTKDKIANYSAPIREYRVHLTVGVPFDAPPVRVKAALDRALAGAPLVRKHPPPEIRLYDFADSRIVYELLYYVPSYADAGPSRDEVFSLVWYQFKKDRISLPYPARDIRIQRPKTGKHAAEIAGTLRKVPLFAGLPDSDLELLALTSAVVVLAPGDTIVAEGEAGTTLFIILEGEVGVSRQGETLASLRPGDFFGEMALLTGEPRQADVVAVSPAQCLEVDREGFRVILEKNPDIVQVVQDIMADRSFGLPADPNRQTDSHARDSLFQRFLKVFAKA